MYWRYITFISPSTFLTKPQFCFSVYLCLTWLRRREHISIFKDRAWFHNPSPFQWIFSKGHVTPYWPMRSEKFAEHLQESNLCSSERVSLDMSVSGSDTWNCCSDLATDTIIKSIEMGDGKNLGPGRLCWGWVCWLPLNAELPVMWRSDYLSGLEFSITCSPKHPECYASILGLRS